MNDTNVVEFAGFETKTTRLIKYVILQTLQIPSILCCLFIFYCVFMERELRKIQNHAFLGLLIGCFVLLLTELPISLTWLRLGSLPIKDGRLCLYWIYMNYTLQTFITLIMAFASIERYVMIFHTNFIMASHYRRIFFHYVPFAFCFILVFVWYFILIFLYPCEHSFDFDSMLCNSACYQWNMLVGTIDWIGSVLLPVIIVICFNILLFIRALIQKRRMNKPIDWRRSMKLIIQLLTIAIVFLFTQVPLSLFAIIRLTADPNFLSYILFVWLYFTPYCIFLIMPFAYSCTTKEVYRHLISAKATISTRTNAIMPLTLTGQR